MRSAARSYKNDLHLASIKPRKPIRMTSMRTNRVRSWRQDPGGSYSYGFTPSTFQSECAQGDPDGPVGSKVT